MNKAVVGLPFAILLLASPALATLGDSATSSSSFTTTQLAAPTALDAVGGCAGLASPKVTLTWTATATTFATGYDIYRAVGVGPSVFLASVSPRTTVTYTDTAVVGLTSYTYIVRTKYQSWTKASTPDPATTPGVCL
jgi:hypothetical protein